LVALNRIPTAELEERSNHSSLLLLRIVLDGNGTAVAFSPDNKHLVWGSQNGSVTVCDLVEVQRRLAGVELGW